VTPQTIRKDLNDLCEQRLLSIASMAARIFPSGIENVEYEARRKIAADEKDAIGRAAAAKRHPRQRLALHQHRHHDGGRQQRTCSTMPG
jgi:DeoR/GlpR family transcriptional regulator of sugar metabolism